MDKNCHVFISEVKLMIVVGISEEAKHCNIIFDKYIYNELHS